MRHFVSMMVSLLVIAFLLLPQIAAANMGAVLGEVEWGDSRDDVLQKLRSEKLSELRNDSSLRSDQAAMQRARQGVLDEIRRVEDSYVELKGDTGFEVSVVAGEFTSDNEESMMRVRDDMAQRFYFFLAGDFYKLVVAYDQDHVQNLGFEAFLGQVRQRYGEPSSTDYGSVRGQEGVVQAKWSDTKHELRINDRRDFFGTFTMTFSDRQTVENLAARDTEFGGSEQDRTEVSDRVRSLSDYSFEDPNADVVDDLVGGSIDVDIYAGQERDEEEEDQEEAAAPTPTPRADSDDRPRERTPRRTSTPTPAADSDDDDDDLVIY